MPWALAKDEAQKARLGGVLYNLLESIRFIAVLLQPFMPETAKSIFAQINTSETSWESLDAFGKIKSGDKVGTATPMFLRLDEAKKLEEIEKSLEKPAEEKKEKIENLISIEDFAKVEIKVGKVLESNYVEGADKLLVSKIKVGDEVKQIVSGIAKYYKPEEFVGKSVAVVTNLKPVKLRGILSEGMILAASDKKNLSLVSFDKEITDGTSIG